EGVGYALCLDKLINTSDNNNLIFKPLEPELKVNLDIVWKKHQVFSKAAKLFLSEIQKELRNTLH
ncbi:MAG: LysR family transcriptional regulator, partial [Clostridium celatum]|nr:LysR family transcriptional regulator [Clostridium celatum]